MTVYSIGTSRSLHALLAPLTTVVAAGLGLFLALVVDVSDAVAIGVGAGYIAVVQGVLQAISMAAAREAW